MEKILVIDDEETNVRVLAMSLRSDDYDVVTAYSGEEGLDVFKEESPEIVLTDIKMPGMDGIEVLKNIKEINPETEVIIITGHGDIDSAIEALQYGASDFINKPVREEALTIALQRAREKLTIRQKLKEYTESLEEKVHEATMEIRRRSHFQTKLIKSSNDGIVASDDQARIVIYNPGSEKIFGYQAQEVIGKMLIQELLGERLSDMLQNGDRKTSGELPWIETTITSKTGENIPVRFSGSILHEKDQMMGNVAFFQDLREIKRLEKELVQSERLAAIGQTVAGMAHCIKNILHGFKGGSYLVDIGIDKNDNDKLKAGWRMIQRNIERTSGLVLDLLSYAKERQPNLKKCSPKSIVEDVCEVLEESARENGIQIIKEFDPAVEMVWLDPSTVHRSLMNLISNAIDACLFDEDRTKKWKIKVSVTREPGNSLRFEVEDNGCGMSEEIRNQLFSSFFSTKGALGTGLGLLVTQKMVSEHDGTIDVQSSEGKGTKFTILLPEGPEKVE